MTVAAVVLVSIAAALEIWGIQRTVRDIRAARRRLASYLELPRTVYGSVHGTLGSPEMTAEVTVGTPTLEQRVEELEAWRRGMRDELKQLDLKVTERLTEQFQGGLRSVEQTTDGQFKKLREYIEGSQQSVWDSYRGPIVLGVGVLFGLAGNIVSAI
ncbi:hypothetical protein [Streptomyces sp. NBC_01451]|uniref:hypothetical protein n=1 Tax=Streptomyces sp. NBC_01451 TaxID=2903872 RepID=UPI002E35EC13|nr:hypothetical protein [Streptomyces sp. NBC_01451]